MFEVKGQNLFRFLRKTVLKGKYCFAFDKHEEINFDNTETKLIFGYIQILRIHDRVLLLNEMKLNKCSTDLFELFAEEMVFIKKNYKKDKWDFYTKKGFKEEIKKVFCEEESEQG